MASVHIIRFNLVCMTFDSIFFKFLHDVFISSVISKIVLILNRLPTHTTLFCLSYRTNRCVPVEGKDLMYYIEVCELTLVLIRYIGEQTIENPFQYKNQVPLFFF